MRIFHKVATARATKKGALERSLVVGPVVSDRRRADVINRPTWPSVNLAFSLDWTQIVAPEL